MELLCHSKSTFYPKGIHAVPAHLFSGTLEDVQRSSFHHAPSSKALMSHVYAWINCYPRVKGMQALVVEALYVMRPLNIDRFFILIIKMLCNHVKGKSRATLV